MLELYDEAFASYNLPATVLLGLVLIYWLTVILGISDGDTGVDATLAKGESLSGTLSSLSGGSGLSKRLGIWPVPLSLFGSMFSVLWWLLTLWLNHYVISLDSARSWGMHVLVGGATAAVSYAICVALFRSMKSFFVKFQGYHGENRTLIGSIGQVSSAEITKDYGQVHVASEGAPLLVNARTEADAQPILKGESVRLLSQHESGNFYYVQPLDNSLSSSL